MTDLRKCNCLVSFTTFEFNIFEGKVWVGRHEGLLSLVMTVRKLCFIFIIINYVLQNKLSIYKY